MKKLHEINNFSELENHRRMLVSMLHKQEKLVTRDLNKINANWSRWQQVGTMVSNIATIFLPKLNMFTLGLTLMRRLFGKKN